MGHLWFQQKMNVIRHHAGPVEFILKLTSSMKDTVKDNVAFFRGQKLTIAGHKCDRVFRPGPLKVRQATAAVEYFIRFRWRAGERTRLACCRWRLAIDFLHSKLVSQGDHFSWKVKRMSSTRAEVSMCSLPTMNVIALAGFPGEAAGAGVGLAPGTGE